MKKQKRVKKLQDGLSIDFTGKITLIEIEKGKKHKTVLPPEIVAACIIKVLSDVLKDQQ